MKHQPQPTTAFPAAAVSFDNLALPKCLSDLRLTRVEKCHKMGAKVWIFCAVFLLATQAIGVPAFSPWKKLHVPWKKDHSKGSSFSSLPFLLYLLFLSYLVIWICFSSSFCSLVQIFFWIRP